MIRLALCLALLPLMAMAQPGPAPDLAVPCGTVPMSDTLNGSVGTGTCYTRSTDTRPTIIQRAFVTTASDGTFAVTWAKAFSNATPAVLAIPLNSTAAAPVTCNPSARDASSVAGKCWIGISTTLGGTLLAIIGLVITPFGSAAGGMTVMVIGGEVTQ